MEMQNDITLEYYSNKPIWYLEYFPYLKFPNFHSASNRGKSNETCFAL